MRDAHSCRRTHDVDALACFGCCTALERRRHGEDGIDAPCRTLETPLVLEVPGNDRDPARREGGGAGRRWLPRQRANRMPAGEQLAHQVAPLFPCRACHEHVYLAGHVVLPFITCCSFALMLVGPIAWQTTGSQSLIGTNESHSRPREGLDYLWGCLPACLAGSSPRLQHTSHH